MGAIVRKLDSVPDPKAVPFDPGTNKEVEKDANIKQLASSQAFVATIVKELGDKNIAPPAKGPADISKDELDLYLRKVIGDKIKAELTNNPLGLDYAGKSNDEIAEMMNEPFTLEGKRLPGSVTMEVIEPLDPKVITLARAKGQAVDLRPFGSNLRGKILRIEKAGKKGEVVAEVGAAKAKVEVGVDENGTSQSLIAANTTNTVELVEPLDTPPEAGDVVTIVDTDTSNQSCRIHQILLGIPFAPNVVTGDDVGAARQ